MPVELKAKPLSVPLATVMSLASKPLTASLKSNLTKLELKILALDGSTVITTVGAIRSTMSASGAPWPPKLPAASV